LPRELDVWPRVSHPNIIRMHDYILNEQKIYMMLEYADGGDMLSYIQKINGPVAERDCKPWMRQILSAVAYLHRMNIIHRDLKLENLLIETSTRMIKLCDFGFAKDLTSRSATSSTSSLSSTSSTVSQSLIDELSRTYCGSKAYASPGLLILL
jgi:serine/threonine protein kinase